MRRWLATALVFAAVILSVEGYFVYRFYTRSDTAEVRPAEQPARGTEPEPAAATGPEVKERPASTNAPEAPARTEPEAKAKPEARDAACRKGQDGCAAGEPDEARYAREAGELQDRAVDVFMDTHEKMRRYDAVTAADVAVMKENWGTLDELSDRVAKLEPPREYEEHHRVVGSTVADLAEAAKIAYGLAADPVSATNSRIVRYDRLVDEAAAGLDQANELLGTEHAKITDVRNIGA